MFKKINSKEKFLGNFSKNQIFIFFNILGWYTTKSRKNDIEIH